MELSYRYIKELKQCVDDNSAMIMSDPECAEMRIIASIVSSQNNKLCNSPLFQSKVANMSMYVNVYLYLYTSESQPLCIMSVVN